MTAPERPVLLLTGASGRLGTAIIASLRETHDIAAVTWQHRLKGPSQRSLLIDPRRPDSDFPDNANAPFEVVADLSCLDQAPRVVELAMARFGRVDCLVHAAGCFAPGGLISTRAADVAGRVFDLNAMSGVRLVSALADAGWRHDPIDNAERNRSVVMMSALSSLDVELGHETAVYAASKSALNMLTCQLAAELGYLAVRVNAVAPAAFPSVIPIPRVVNAVQSLTEGQETGRIVALWSDEDELI